jgi:hypothetical protein
MSVRRRSFEIASALAFALVATPLPAVALSDSFSAPLSATWNTPRTEEPGSAVTAPVPDTAADDGQVLELLYPGGTADTDTGPAFASELETAAPNGFGVYEARLRTPKTSRMTGLVSAFFTYFNDGTDHDHDGIVDNHEIDFEFLGAEPSAIYMSVWTEYQEDVGGETFHKVTRKVDLRHGRVWETPPGGEGSYDLVEVAPLAWTARKYRHSRSFNDYRIDWQSGQVEFSIDLEDGQGYRVLWTLTGAPDVTIPSIPAPLFFNLWHNATHWNNGNNARVPMRDMRYHVDSVVLP